MSRTGVISSETDRAQLAELGITVEEVERQIALFTDPPPPARLDRPCTLGDGIRTLSTAERSAALRAHGSAAAAGRVSKFTPASGAASRMFQAPLAIRAAGVRTRAALTARAADGDAAARDVLELTDAIERFAFAEALDAVLARGGQRLAALRAAGEIGPMLDALLGEDGLDYAALPKGLLLFHRYPDGARTAFEEHLVEAAAIARAADGRTALHFTVSPEHTDQFARLLADIRAREEARLGAHFSVGFSTQARSTDTIAVDLDNRPFRTADGRLLFRPGGHGALIENLAALDADLVIVRNIDNVQPDHLRAATVEWSCLLTGHAAVVHETISAHVRALREGTPPPAAIEAARRYATAGLGLPLAVDADARAIADALDRPLRICGVVRNTGEPGGGPFWVRGAAGVSAQIVESAQVDRQDPAQQAIFAAATHFNPVFLVCALRDWQGRRFDLRRYVDASAVFIAEKSSDGRPLKALERPGLWNGAMAHWLTLFIEVPEATFTPVKTVNDLLRPAHQPAG